MSTSANKSLMASCAIALLMAVLAHAQTPSVYDGLAYDDGFSLSEQSGGFGWDNEWRSNFPYDATITFPGLTYTKGGTLPTGAGAVILDVNASGGNTSAWRRPSDTFSGDSFWMSGLVQLNSETEEGAMFRFVDSNDATYRILIDQEPSAGGFKASLTSGNGRNDIGFAGGPLPEDEPIFLVLQLDRSAGENGTVNAWINPDVDGASPANALGSGSMELKSPAGGIKFLVFEGFAGSTHTFDEMRLGDSFEAVTAAHVNAAFDLVRDGGARAVVVVAREPTPTAEFAALELIDHLERATGATLPLANEGAIPEGYAHHVYVGPTDEAARRGIDYEGLAPDAYIIRTDKGDLFMGGAEREWFDPLAVYPPERMDRTSERNMTYGGTTRAVHAFLRRAAGVRWIWPGDLGTYIPLRATLWTDAWDVRESPVFGQRELRNTPWRQPPPSFATLSTNETKEHRNARNLFFKRHGMGYSRYVTRLQGHFFKGWWRALGEEHPEWFAAGRDGERPQWDGGGQSHMAMCVSAPGLHDYVVEHHAPPGVWTRGRHFGEQYINLTQADTSRFCWGERCMSWDGPQPETIRNTPWDRVVSDRYAKFWKLVHSRFAGTLPTEGNAVVLNGNASGGNTSIWRRPSDTFADENFWMSGLIQLNSETEEGAMFRFVDSNGATYRILIDQEPSAGGFKASLTSGNGHNDVGFAGGPLPEDEPIFLVLQLDRSAGENGTVNAWINPDVDGTSPANALGSGSMELNSPAGGIKFLVFEGVAGSTHTYAEMRLGASFEAVIAAHFSAQAQIPSAYEGFNYGDGFSLSEQSGGFGWDNNWGTNFPDYATITASGLTYTKGGHPDIITNVLLYWQTFHAPTTDIQLNENIHAKFVPWRNKTMWMPMPEEDLEWVKEQWRGWRETGITMTYRPNFPHSGGYVLPFADSRQTGEMIQWVAENGSVGVEIDSIFGNWSTRGPMLYVLARMIDEPGSDVERLRAEYFEAFGPAADQIEAYFDYWEAYSRQLVREENWPLRGVRGMLGAPEHYGENIFEPAARLLDEALSRADNSDNPRFAQRVRFVGLGLENARLSMAFLRTLEDGQVVRHDRERFEAARNAWREVREFRREHSTLPFIGFEDVDYWEAELLDDAEILERPFAANLLNFAFAGNPGEPDTSILPRLEGGGEELPVFIYRRGHQAVEKGVGFRLEYSTDLLEWHRATDLVSEVIDAVKADHDRIRGELKPDALPEEKRLFLRLRVE